MGGVMHECGDRESDWVITQRLIATNPGSWWVARKIVPLLAHDWPEAGSGPLGSELFPQQARVFSLETSSAKSSASAGGCAVDLLGFCLNSALFLVWRFVAQGLQKRASTVVDVANRSTHLPQTTRNCLPKGDKNAGLAGTLLCPQKHQHGEKSA
jgi:hypothetical protein